jgi:two-component sensor histidine kinase
MLIDAMRVAPSITVKASFPASPLASRAAREVVRPLEPELSTRVLESLRLILSELVTNGVRYGAPSGSVELTVRVDDRAVRGEVRNRRGRSIPRLQQPGERLEGGLGLLLLDRLSSRWGSSVKDDVMVWFELPLSLPARHTHPV